MCQRRTESVVKKEQWKGWAEEGCGTKNSGKGVSYRGYTIKKNALKRPKVQDTKN